HIGAISQLPHCRFRPHVAVMSFAQSCIIALLVVAAAAVAVFPLAVRSARERGLHHWIGSYARGWRRRKSPPANTPVHVLICIADHYEPRHGAADPTRAAQRVHHWTTEYPRLFSHFRDSDGLPPRHTFFFPIDEYEPS